MIEPVPAGPTEPAVHFRALIGRPGPEFRFTFNDFQRTGGDNQRQPMHGTRLLPALAAMTGEKRYGLSVDAVADGAALATSSQWALVAVDHSGQGFPGKKCGLKASQIGLECLPMMLSGA